MLEIQQKTRKKFKAYVFISPGDMFLCLLANTVVSVSIHFFFSPGGDLLSCQHSVDVSFHQPKIFVGFFSECSDGECVY